MKLSAEQQAAVRTWAAGGATLNDIQNRLREELGLNMTYMEARLLLIDLDVTLQDPKDEEKEEKKAEAAADAGADAGEGDMDDAAAFDDADDEDASGPSSVRVSLDELTIPGTVASGGVTFSDGKTAKWYLDQMGRLGLQASDPGYQPPTADIPAFQRQLQALLSRM